MKVRIVLSGSGPRKGELDRLTMELPDAMTLGEISNQIHDELDAWTLAPGDTITIQEVGP